MSFKGFIDPPEPCSFGCPHHGAGSCEPCAFKYYPLSPEIAIERRAKFVGVCSECAAIEYIEVLPADAVMA